jgi:hypothetical protein
MSPGAGSATCGLVTHLMREVTWFAMRLPSSSMRESVSVGLAGRACE